MQTQYLINDMFYSLQGEGMRAGTANTFIRFAACNQRCLVATHGFDCDTEFRSGTKCSADEIFERMHDLTGDSYVTHAPRSVIFTGGEPALQLDRELVEKFQKRGIRCAIETNGSINVDALKLDWVCVSPKVAEHALKQLTANEIKYVRNFGQGIPKPVIQADHYLISPAFDGNALDRKTLDWCIRLVKENPAWKLSIQQHKIWSVR